MTETDLAMKVLELKKELQALQIETEAIKKVCRTCCNELCLHCGGYHNEHLGACDNCRWKAVRHGDITGNS